MYHKALIIGATSGIGHGLATKLVSQGTHVLLVGRRENLLNDLVNRLGAANATAIPFDITNLSSIPSFADKTTAQHPDIDCLVLNSGIQRAFDFSNPSTLDLTALDAETTTNYTSHVHLTAAFLRHFLSRPAQQQPTSLIYISATLALVPGLLRTPNYNASKAALHTFILNLRLQLRRSGKSPQLVKIIEVFPPAVQTEIHDEKHQPDLVDGGSIGMPLGEYVDAMVEGLEQGKEEFAVGHGQGMLDGFEAERQRQMGQMVEMLDGSFGKYLKEGARAI
ncbi:uncharacterized protein HMPREF1541_01530 [Cyphellophora europaea CBS 101466]|uniref:Uncharacterized protein n=1 Tax=Cyphellophora europaea (strain CBS 101466) TaxID=1220924 RepID=W2S112_CYPE1|nr:uncharacterized protein HMPREF1541_01530 [Cyphellophora europaea CBS 101466]ETN42376.1 hypothetical protein HMPREF1541_01530 [Cyphellophora europaea CBS 101466]